MRWLRRRRREPLPWEPRPGESHDEQSRRLIAWEISHGHWTAANALIESRALHGLSTEGMRLHRLDGVPVPPDVQGAILYSIARLPRARS